MTEIILKLLDLQPAARSQSEIDMAFSWFQKKSQLFHDLPKEIAVEIIRQSQYITKVTDDIIIRQGDKGDTFYIVLNGKISIYIDVRLTDNGQENTAPLARNQVKPGKNSLTSDNTNANVDKVVHKLDRNSLGNYIISQEEGYSFGEIALMTKENTRNATIVADCECTFLVLHRDMYNQFLMEHQQREFNERGNFVKSNSLFRNWTPRFLKHLQMSLQKKCVEFGVDIVQQGQDTDGIQFLISGTAEMVVEPHKHRNQFEMLYPFLVEDEDELRRSKERCAVVVNEKVTQSKPIRMEHVRIRRANGYTAAEQLHQNRRQSICLLRAGEVVGDIEMLCGLRSHVATVRSVEKCQLYILDARAFDRLLSKQRSTMEELRENVQLKLEIRGRTLCGEILPLFKCLYSQLRSERKVKPRSAKLPALTNSKFPPSDDQLWQHTLIMYKVNRAPLLHTYQASFFYKDLMQTSASRRGAVRVEVQKPQARTIRQLIQVSSSNEAEEAEVKNEEVFEMSSQKEEPLYKTDRLSKINLPRTKKCTPLQKNGGDKHKLPAVLSTSTLQTTEPEQGGSQMHPHFIEEETHCLKERLLFFDWETSEQFLHSLETRLHSFFDRLDKDFYQQKPLQSYLPKLRRYKSQKDGRNVPKQGGRVLVKKRIRYSTICPNIHPSNQAPSRFKSSKHPRIYAHMVDNIHAMEHVKHV